MDFTELLKRANEGDATAGNAAVEAVYRRLHELATSRTSDRPQALDAPTEIEPRKAPVVELRCPDGLSYQESAGVLDTSLGTVKRDWTVAKTWLQETLMDESAGESDG